MRFLRYIAVMASPFVLATTLVAQALDVQLQRAIQREMATGDTKAAISEYRRIADRAGANRAVAAEALLRLAEAYQKQGNAEASKVYEQIVARYPEQSAAGTARTRLVATSVGFDMPLGLWKGTYSDGVRSFAVEVTVTGGRPGAIVGSVRYPNSGRGSLDGPVIDCGGELILRSTTAAAMVLSERLTYGQTACINDGTVTLTALQDGSLEYRWRIASRPKLSGRGVLKKALADEEIPVRLAWVDRSGKELSVIGEPGPYRGVDISPDGKRLVVHLHTASGGDIWIGGIGGPLSRLTAASNPAVHNASPIWSSVGTHIAYGSLRAGKWGIYRARADKSAAEERLLESTSPIVPMEWVADRALIAYRVLGDKTGSDVWALPLSGDRKPYALMQSSFNENQPQVSPDGKWVAYFGNESGSQQVHIRPFPSGEGHWQVSVAGGSFPRWRGDGRELYFLSSPSNGAMMAASITDAGTSLQVGNPRPLFDSGYRSLSHPDSFNYHPYAVTPDGQTFLIPRP